MSIVNAILSSFSTARCTDIFRFLETEYGFQTPSIERSECAVCVTYIKQDVALKVYFEPFDYGLALFMAKVIEGRVPRYPMAMGEDRVIEQFDFNNVLRLRAPDSKALAIDHRRWRSIEPVYEALSLYARELQSHGRDILQGDLSVFPAVFARIDDIRRNNRRRPSE